MITITRNYCENSAWFMISFYFGSISIVGFVSVVVIFRHKRLDGRSLPQARNETG